MLATIQTFLEIYLIIAPIILSFSEPCLLSSRQYQDLFLMQLELWSLAGSMDLSMLRLACSFGSMTSFFIGRKFREPFLGKFISIQKIHEWEDKLSEKEKFWALISIRFISSPFFDIINYVAGLTKIKAATYFWTTLIVTAPLDL